MSRALWGMLRLIYTTCSFTILATSWTPVPFFFLSAFSKQLGIQRANQVSEMEKEKPQNKTPQTPNHKTKQPQPYRTKRSRASSCR